MVDLVDRPKDREDTVSGMPSALTPDSSTPTEQREQQRRRAWRSRFPPVCGANLPNGTELEERLQSESDAIDRRVTASSRPIAWAQVASCTTTIAAKSTWIPAYPEQPDVSQPGKPGQSRVWTIPLKDRPTVNIPRCGCIVQCTEATHGYPCRPLARGCWPAAREFAGVEFSHTGPDRQLE